MVNRQGTKHLFLTDRRRLSIIIFSLFSPWMLAFAFEGQILYALAGLYGMDPHGLVFGAIAALFVGIVSCGFFVTNAGSANGMMLISLAFCMAGSIPFFFSPTILWNILLTAMSFMYGICLASWSYCLKMYTPAGQRIRTIADGIIYSNILMIAVNMIAIHISPRAGLVITILMLGAAFYFTLGLSEKAQSEVQEGDGEDERAVSPIKPLLFLCLFIAVITINSGLMYQVINPAFSHHTWLVSWYWALPYIAALYIMKSLPERTNRTYILYVAIAMIGFSFISFMTFDRSAGSYLIVNTLMLGACGVYDLFWWSILGEMLDFHRNPAKIFGIGLSANVLGVLLGGLLGSIVTAPEVRSYIPSVLALAVVFVILIILPLLHKQLSVLLQNHVFLTALSGMPPHRRDDTLASLARVKGLTDREIQIAGLLLRGRTYRMIAGELYLSENTVKTHIKNIYSKLCIRNRTELIKFLTGQEYAKNR